MIRRRPELESGQDQINSGWNQITAGEQELADAEAKLEEAEAEIADGWEEYYEGEAEAEAEIADGEQKIADAKEELADAENEIIDIEMPEWYIYDRSNLPDYTGYGENADPHAGDRRSVPGDIFPCGCAYQPDDYDPYGGRTEDADWNTQGAGV